ncbi:MAG: hypothetical protein IPJ12_00845 [Betaproteobacteria bacterium]|nr:hypothetical protein [Betaproteobacteria bacterium]
MSLKGLAHLSYVRERVHGHVFIVRCQSADGTEVAGRLSYVPDSGGTLRIDGQAYRKVDIGEQSVNAYPLISRFARDAVHLVAVDAIDRVWDPFAVRCDKALDDGGNVALFFDELSSAVALSGAGRTGLIGSRLVASAGVEAQSDFDIAVQGAGGWASAARVVDDWIRRGAARVLPDQAFPEFDARRAELGLDADMLRSIRRDQWWRKLGIGTRLVSVSSTTGLGSLPAEISETPAEVLVDLSPGYVAGVAPYVCMAAVPGSALAGALHLSWFLRQGCRGRVKGRLVEAGGRQWVWMSKPEELVLTA